MKVFVTGATGFVGSALCLALRRRGHEVVALTRRPKDARDSLGAEIEICDSALSDEALTRVIGECDAVINLAGAPVAQRWTESTKATIWRSRVDLTQRVVDAMRRCAKPPKTLLSTSAVGIYGDRGDALLDHQSELGEDWLAELTKAWEAEAANAAEFGTRVVSLRIGLVLGREGGVLAKMLPAFRAGVGGRLGSGAQWMPWIHLDDLVRLFMRALEDGSWEGVVEAVGPAPVTNREFTRVLGEALGRPTLFPVPTVALRLLFGGAGRVIVASQRCMPTRTLELGFEFRFARVEDALADLLDDGGVRIEAAASPPSHPYLDARGATHCLEQATVIDAPLDEVFAFFERAENLGPLTPPSLAFDTKTPGPLRTEKGAQIEHRIKLGPVPMSWLTEIVDHESDSHFIDVQLRGPYRAWFHEHRFEARGSQTHMLDRVHYKVPFGPIGRVANRLFVQGQLRRIFGFRAAAIRRRFGEAAGQPASPSAQSAAE